MNSRFVKERMVPASLARIKLPPSRDKAVHRVADTKVGMPARINAIVLGPASHLLDGRAYHMYNMSLYIGVESFYGKPQDS